MKELYAHTPNDKGEWHKLDKHLLDVAEMAQSFADKFQAGDLAYWLDYGTIWEKAILNFKITLKHASVMKDMKKFRMQYGGQF